MINLQRLSLFNLKRALSIYKVISISSKDKFLKLLMIS